MSRVSKTLNCILDSVTGFFTASQALPLSSADRKQLEDWERSGKTEQRVAFRSRIILKAAEGLSNPAIARELDTSRSTVIDWRCRFEAGGPKALCHDRPRGKSFTGFSLESVAQVIDRTLYVKPETATHWSCRSMAELCGISKASVQRIWHAHGLKPHLVKNLKLSSDPGFMEKVTDVVGLYMAPPEHALVLCVDEKSQDNNYKSNGTKMLFGALDALKGEVIGECMERNRHEEFLTFLKAVNRRVPKDLDVHCIVDNYATHKKDEVREWLQKHPRFYFHFIPADPSWLNLVERWLAEMVEKRIRFTTVEELERAIYAYIADNNGNPFTWTKSANKIIRKIRLPA